MAREQLSMQTLKDRRKNHRTQLLMIFLSDEDKHKSLSSAYDDELTIYRDRVTMTTSAAIRGEPQQNPTTITVSCPELSET